MALGHGNTRGAARGSLVAALLALCACSKQDKGELKEPWAAPTSAGSAKLQTTRVVRYAISPESRVIAELRTKQTTITGLFRVLRGELDLNLSDLAQSRAGLSVDLGSVLIDASETMDQFRHTAEAQNWLDVGASKPETERSRLRWARFNLLDLREPSASAPHLGKTVKVPPAAEAAAPALLSSPSDAGAPPPALSFRTVELVAHGELTVHGFKAEYDAPVRATFHYSGPVDSGARPQTVTIQSRAPLVVPLKAHDIKPRDATGVVIARDMSLLGTQVAQEARLWVHLVFADGKSKRDALTNSPQ